MIHFRTVRPDWLIYWTLDNFSKPLATINLPKSLTLLGNFWKGVKIYHFLVESFLGNFYRHMAIFFWSHWLRSTTFLGCHSTEVFHSFQSFKKHYKMLKPFVFRSRANTINTFFHSCCSKALWLDVPSNMTILNQWEWINSAKCNFNKIWK